MGDGAGGWGSQELRKDGFDLCENRFIELRPVLDEVHIQRGGRGVGALD